MTSPTLPFSKGWTKNGMKQENWRTFHRTIVDDSPIKGRTMFSSRRLSCDTGHSVRQERTLPSDVAPQFQEQVKENY